MGMGARMGEMKLNHLNRQFKHDKESLVEHCPICFNTNIFNKNNGEWKQSLRCCHLRSITKEDDKYIGHFSYELGCFEGIKEALS